MVQAGAAVRSRGPGADTYSQPVPIPSPVQQQARAMRPGLPAGVKVLVVHADTDWFEKRWPIT
ncbi:hypothetical protein ACOJVU_01725 [Mycobacterium sp. THU-M104]|uniref:hypothetical protein n=1 Tax=Mycobacterium sp. THU-M104 TaxID=3410515 RepID=UPI003B9AF6E5